MYSKLKTIWLWVRSHTPVILGFVIVTLVVDGSWKGTLSVPEGAALAVVGLGMMGFHLTGVVVANALQALAASGADYRAGKPAVAVASDLKPIADELLPVIGRAPLTLTLTGESREVLAAATAIQAPPQQVKG